MCWSAPQVTTHTCYLAAACRLDALGGPHSIPGLVDLLAFASSCRGASEEEVSMRSDPLQMCLYSASQGACLVLTMRLRWDPNTPAPYHPCSK